MTGNATRKVFNSKKHNFMHFMAIRLSLRQTLRRLRRILMNGGLRRVILLVAICWSWWLMCYDNNVKGCEPLLDIMTSFQTCLGRHLIVHGIMPLNLLWIAAWKMDLNLMTLMTKLQTLEGMIKSKVRRSKHRCC